MLDELDVKSTAFACSASLGCPLMMYGIDSQWGYNVPLGVLGRITEGTRKSFNLFILSNYLLIWACLGPLFSSFYKL